MQEPTFTTCLASSSQSLPELPQKHLNLLPFSLKFSGKAPIDTYFQPQEAGSSSYASFRGRRVYSNTVDLPAGFTGYLLSGPAKPSSSDIDVVSNERLGAGKLLTPAPSMVSHIQEEEGGPRRSPRKAKVQPVAVARAVPMRMAGKKASVAAKRKFRLDSDSEEESEQEAPVMVVERPIKMASRSVPKLETEEVEACQEEAKMEPDEPLAHRPEASARTPPMTSEDVQAVLPPTKERHLVPTATFKSFLLWTPDAPWEGGVAEGGNADEFVKGLGEWRELDAEINAPVDWSLYEEPVIV